MVVSLSAMKKTPPPRKSPFLGGRRIAPRPVRGDVKAADLVERVSPLKLFDKLNNINTFIFVE